MLFETQLAPGTGVYVGQMSFTLRGALEREALRRAWEGVLERYSALRTAFVDSPAGGAVQVVRRRVALPWVEEDWRPRSAAGQEEAVQAYLAEDRARGFEPERAPLTRVALLRTGEAEHVLVWSFHQMVLDGWSLPLVFRDVMALYQAARGGGEARLERAGLFREYMEWLSRQDLEEAERYWRGVLAGFTAPTPLVLKGAEAGAEPGVGVAEARLTEEGTRAVQAAARRCGVTVNTVLQGAWALLLSRYAGEEDVVFGTTVSGRPTELEAVEEMVGLFINTLPVRVEVRPEAELGAWLREVQARSVALREREFTPLVQVQGWSEVARGAPLFESIVVFENYPVDLARAAPPRRELEVAQRDVREQGTLPLAVVGTLRSELVVRVQYQRSRFGAGAVERLAGHLETVLETMAAGPGRRLSELSLLRGAERAQVLEEWNRTERPYPREICIHELFEAQVRERPGVAALVWGGLELTYAELDARANRLAHHLAGLGVGPESRVGVLLERGPELIVSLLAVLKAGGCYVPLDPGYPAERLELMLADSGAEVLLSRSELSSALAGSGRRVVCLDGAAEALASEPVEAPRSGATAENLAYMVYTSGSTGKPKGVMVAHRHVVQLVCETDYVRFRPGDRVAQASNASFDALTFETWGAFLGGATLVGIDRDVLLSPAALRAFLAEERITTLYQTTALLNQLSREQPGIFAPLREVLFGGQASDADRVRALLRTGKPQRLLHMYGPTETTAWCSWEEVEHVDADALTVSVGRPTGNQRIYLLDSALNPVPVGVPGEAYVGGAGVVRGYLERPGLTAERFVPDPFTREPGARMYRTGDRLRWRREGKLEFMGRLDEQVKIRGFRIELGEVESVVAAHEAVREARVVVREDAPGEQRLVAYVVGEVEAEVVRAYLRQSLPEYMVPAAIVTLERLPLTPNGKLDRKALPAPEYGSGEERYVAPRTPVEEVLAGTWAEVLHLERVGVEENFFELGGHSLLATRVVSRVRQAFGVELPLRALFEVPTVAGLAGRVEALLQAGGEGTQAPPLAALPRDGAALPLSFAQQRLWFIDQLEPGSAAYNMPYALRLWGRFDPAVLKWSLREIVSFGAPARGARHPVGRGDAAACAVALVLRLARRRETGSARSASRSRASS